MATVYYWSGLSQANLSLFDEHRDAITCLLRGETRRGDLSLKKHRDHPLYTIRLNDADRLLFTTIERNGKSYILLLEVIENHDYQKSRFMKSGVLQQYLKSQTSTIAEVVDAEELFDTCESTDVVEAVDSTDAVETQPVTHYQQQWIMLDDSQQGASVGTYPLLVSGPPGSGKSCVALTLLGQGIKTQTPGDSQPLLCVTESPHVAKHLQTQWESLPEALDEAGNVRDDIKFLTYKQLLCEILHADASQLVDADHFHRWYAARPEGKRSPSNGRRSPQHPLQDPELVYQECRIISTCDTLEAYQALGESQSLLTDETHRSQLWAIYEAYQAELSQNNLISPDFHTLSGDVHFSRIVVDEAQDFSMQQLMNLQALSGNRTAYAMDTNQNLMSQVSIAASLQRHMHTLGLTLTQAELHGSYRCPVEVLRLANGVLQIKNHVMQGTTDRLESTEVTSAEDQQDSGITAWMVPPEDAAAFQRFLSEVRSQHNLNETELAIITPAEHIDRVRRETGCLFVFTPEQIKGLEFKCIIAYEPLSYPALKEADKHLPDGDDAALQVRSSRVKEKANEQMAYAPYFNRVFVSFTRATEVLLVLQSAEHKLRHMTSRLTALTTDDKAEAVADGNAGAGEEKGLPTTQRSEWEAAFKRLVQSGNMEQAEALYNQHLTSQGESFSTYLEAVMSTAESPAAVTAAPKSPGQGAAYGIPVKKKSKNNTRRRRGRRGKHSPPAAAAKPHEAPAEAAKQPDEISVEEPVGTLDVLQRLPDLFKALDIDDPSRLDGCSLLLALTESTAMRIRLLVNVATDKALTRVFLTWTSPYSPRPGEEEAEGPSKIHLLTLLLVQLTSFGGLTDLWEDLLPYLTPEIINNPFMGVIGLPDGCSLLSYLCEARLELLDTHWDRTKHLITREGFNQPLLSPSPHEGYTPFCRLVIDAKRIAFLDKNWADIRQYITAEGLHQEITDVGDHTGKTAFYWLCTQQAGLALMEKHWEDFADKITPADLQRTVTGEDPKHQGNFPFMALCKHDHGAFLKKHWTTFRHLLTPALLHQSVEHSTDRAESYSTPFLMMCREWEYPSPDSPQQASFLDQHWGDICDKITTEGLSENSFSSGPLAGTPHFFALCSYALSREVLYRHWRDFKPHITPEAFNKPVVLPGQWQGRTPLYSMVYASTAMKFWQDYPEDMIALITPEGFNRPVTGSGTHEGYSPLYLFCSSTLKLQFMIEHWEHFRRLILTYGLHQTVSAVGPDNGKSSLYHLCTTALGRQLLQEHWDDFKPLLSVEHLEEGLCTKEFIGPTLSACLRVPNLVRIPGLDDHGFFERKIHELMQPNPETDLRALLKHLSQQQSDGNASVVQLSILAEESGAGEAEDREVNASPSSRPEREGHG